jgi:hypothetical protein
MKVVALAALLGFRALYGADSNAPQISGPYTHDNLSVFLIHGASADTATHYVTLKDAMEAKQVIVHETKNVNNLAIENVSGDTVFIQGGDIVKGGQQDRTLTNDFFLPAKSGKLAISAFCVEQGRWTRRGDEPVKNFSVSSMMARKAVKEKVTGGGTQQQVWAEVASVQTSVAAATGGGFGLASRASLQLTLEDKKVQEKTSGYLKALRDSPKAPDLVGVVFAINGELNSGDVYSLHELFSLMWPKLLNSIAFEAVRSRKDGAITAPPSAAVAAFLNAGDGGQTIRIDHRTNLTRREVGNRVVIESRDGERWIHRSYLSK